MTFSRYGQCLLKKFMNNFFSVQSFLLYSLIFNGIPIRKSNWRFLCWNFLWTRDTTNLLNNGNYQTIFHVENPIEKWKSLRMRKMKCNLPNEVSPFDGMQSKLSIGLFACVFNTIPYGRKKVRTRERENRNDFRKFGKIIYFEIYKVMESAVLDTYTHICIHCMSCMILLERYFFAVPLCIR